jgi:hypothetical protein
MTITIQATGFVGASIRGGICKPKVCETIVNKVEMEMLIKMSPGRPMAKEIQSFFRGLVNNEREKSISLMTLLPKARYQRRTRDGIEYVMVLPSSRIIEKGIVSTDSSRAEKPEV